jgi:putative oxidoreductase
MKRIFFTSHGAWNNGILLVRLFTALMIFPHGLEMFDPKQMSQLTGLLDESHFPAPVFMAHLAKCTELAGGILLAAGLFTRIITLPLMICMVVVTWLMGGGNIFNSDTSTLFFLLFLGFFLTGPGKWSLDYYFFNRKSS